MTEIPEYLVGWDGVRWVGLGLWVGLGWAVELGQVGVVGCVGLGRG